MAGCLSLILAVALVVGAAAGLWARRLVGRARREAQAAGERATALYEAERRARASAEATSRAQDELLATLAHELRTPLNAVLSWAGLLRTGRVGADTTPRALEAIEQNAQAQARLIRDFLGVSRLVGGQPAEAWEPVDLGACLDAALGTVAPSAEEKRLTLTVTREDQRAFVRGDPARLQQVLWNLLTNAIKFTPPGGRVAVALSYAGGEATFRVTDSGCGIVPDELPGLFDRFAGAEGARPRRRRGLGLGIVRHLVEAHGGSVSAASEGDGRGSTFTVRLPLER